jgi:F-type H+-transporting ATPase subunit epsilon
MAEQLQLEIVTPERRVLSEAVEAVTIPAANGELGVLPGHTPLISQLQSGILSYTRGNTTERLHVAGGFIEVNHDRVSVLAEVAERPEEIDAARARLARERAEKTLSAWNGTEEDFEMARARLKRSLARLQLVAGDNTIR